MVSPHVTDADTHSVESGGGGGGNPALQLTDVNSVCNITFRLSVDVTVYSNASHADCWLTLQQMYVS